MSTRRRRLDVLLVERGLAESRARAQALILAGHVHVGGYPRAKAGTPLPADVEIAVAAPEHPWVSRGGVKLAHALETFGIDVAGRLALDIGASTGGFTDVLLRRGARRVIAVDVGHGQLHWKLRTDPRVTLHEGVNARVLARATLPELGAETGVDVVTIDVAFISVTYILPVLPSLLAHGADVVVLIKPQFEAGRHEVGEGGIVRAPAVHARVVAAVTAAATEVGLTRAGLIESPIAGSDGNREFLAHFRQLPPTDHASAESARRAD